MHLNRKRGDGSSVLYPFGLQLPFCALLAFLFSFFFHTVVCVFFGGTQKFSIFGWANLHMTARMFPVRCVCVLEFWQTHFWVALPACLGS